MRTASRGIVPHDMRVVFVDVFLERNIGIFIRIFHIIIPMGPLYNRSALIQVTTTTYHKLADIVIKLYTNIGAKSIIQLHKGNLPVKYSSNHIQTCIRGYQMVLGHDNWPNYCFTLITSVTIPINFTNDNKLLTYTCVRGVRLTSWVWTISFKSYHHYSDVRMSETASLITSVSAVCSTVGSGADQRTQQSFASLVFVRGIHRWPVDSPHKGPVMRNIFPFDGVMRANCIDLIIKEILSNEYKSLFLIRSGAITWLVVFYCFLFLFLCLLPFRRSYCTVVFFPNCTFQHHNHFDW